MIYAYFSTGRDILSPWLISCTMYLISIIVVAINDWNIEISLKTILTIISALILFGLGELIVRYTIGNKQEEFYLTIEYSREKALEIPKYILVVTSIFMLVVLYWYFNETYRISLIGGNPGGYSMMLKYARSASATNSINTILTLLLAICMSIAYVFIFIILYNIIYFGKRTQWKIFFIPLLLFICQLTLTTGRQVFIQLISTTIIMSYILVKYKSNWRGGNTKLLYIGVFSIGIFLAGFFALGFLTNKSFLGFSTTISLYLGGSIVGLNHYLQSPFSDSSYFGGHTLFGLYSSLGQMGFDIPKLNAPLDFF